MKVIIDMNKKYYIIDFIGYENYPIRYLRYILSKFKHKNLNLFLLAINEAVCNAARYTTTSINTCHINLQIYCDDNYIKVLVVANTNHNFAKDLKKKLNELKNEKSWAKCLKSQIRGRGFWIMLEGTDCIYVDEFMQSVLLIKKINKINSKYLNLSELLNKFHISIPKNIIGG